jgi:hypothetical protein
MEKETCEKCGEPAELNISTGGLLHIVLVGPPDTKNNKMSVCDKCLEKFNTPEWNDENARV